MLNKSFSKSYQRKNILTHRGRVTHICVSKLTIIGSDNGLSPNRRQAIIWTSAGLLLIGPLGTKFSEIIIEILTFSFKKMRLKVSSAKRRPFCLGLSEKMPQVNVKRPHWWWVNIASNNDFVPSGKKQLPDPKLTKLYDAIWRHQATMNFNWYGIKSHKTMASIQICHKIDKGDKIWICIFLKTQMKYNYPWLASQNCVG